MLFLDSAAHRLTILSGEIFQIRRHADLSQDQGTYHEITHEANRTLDKDFILVTRGPLTAVDEQLASYVNDRVLTRLNSPNLANSLSSTAPRAPVRASVYVGGWNVGDGSKVFYNGTLVLFD
jgi:hypothetical protein